MTIQARQAAHRLGHVAEWRAVWRLRLAGYSVLARRYKTKLGEIDIVVRRGGILAFVEVKARADFLTATDALGNRQFGRVARAASLYLARHPHCGVQLRQSRGSLVHFGREERERDLLSELQVVGAEDVAHPALAQPSNDAVTAAENGAGGEAAMVDRP